MGPVRHRQLIRLLAFVVAFDLVAGVAVLYDRGGPASAAGVGPQAPEARERSGDAAAGTDAGAGGILAAGQFDNRRGSGQATAGSPAEVAKAPDPSVGTSTSTVTTPSQSTAPAAASSVAPGTPGTKGKNGSSGGQGANRTTVSSASQTTAAFSDPTGDTVVDGSGVARAERAADIVQSHVVYSRKAIVFAVQTDQSADPRQDPRWASDSTFISWELDTNGDSAPDYEIQYSLTEGTPVAGLSRLSDADAASVCEAEAGYMTEGYAVGFDPACIGGPAAISYRVTIYYDTDPSNEEADVVTDVAPDGGLSRPVARPKG